MKKSLHPLTTILVTLSFIGSCIGSVSAQFTPTLYRALNLNGAALTIDGNNWETSLDAPNFSYTTNGWAFEEQGVTLSPTTDANRATMIRSSLWGDPMQLNLTSVPNGSYDVYMYVWEDNDPATFSVSLEGTIVLPSHNSGSAGTWSKLGPFRVSITDGSINVSTDGGHSNISGIEIYSISESPVDPETPSVSSVLEQFAFQYKYDERKRMSHKKVPGADWVYMVYDDRDRLVMTQDGNQRDEGVHQWLFTKYDELNRPILTGIYTDTADLDQSGMQLKVNNFYTAAQAPNTPDEWFEVRGTAVHGYTNHSFPNVNTQTDYLTVTYYDDYTFKSLMTTNAADFNYDNDQLTASANDEGQENIEFTRVHGQVTATQVKNLDTDEFFWTVNYFDDRYRVIQVIAQNNKGGVDKITNVYDFVGKVLRTKTDHAVTGANPLAIATTRKLTYDHSGRLLQTEHQTGTADPVVISKNEYNELGQLVTKHLHSEDEIIYKQQVDYRYNIRGWLTRINNNELSLEDGGPKDYFGMNLTYSFYYNGNISSIFWSTNLGLGVYNEALETFEPRLRGYIFIYDPLNRLTDALHLRNNESLLFTQEYEEKGIGYDLNGNILNLDRYGKGGNNMDSLVYSYSGNRLMKVVDNGNDQEGFKDGNVNGDDYIYDDNGNMITDKNKNIATIEYNHLNLPAKVTKDNGAYVKYIYNATGVKLSQVVYDSTNALKKKTDYMGEFFYENDTLKFINHEEGRIVTKGIAPEYQYTLKDHLGNTRITFTTKHEIEMFTANLDPSNEEEEQNTFGAYNSYPNQANDPTPAENLEDQVLILNGSLLEGQYNGQVGLTKTLSVVPGDIVRATVKTKYSDLTSNPSNLANFATALTQAFALTPTPPSEGISPFEAVNAFGMFISAGGRVDRDVHPKGFLTIIVFDKDYNFVDVSYEQIYALTDELNASVTIRQAGYAYVFLSNEGATQQLIGFDNYTLTHEHSDVIQQDDYYPFGLTFNSYQRENSLKQKFKFQGQEHVDDLGLNWDSFKWRNHQPDIGRFFNVDPLADKYVYNSPYAFSENHVTSHVELEGLEKENFMSKFKKPSELAVKRPSENAQQQSYGVTVTGSKKSFSEMKSSFLEAPQNLLTNSKAEFNSPVDGDGNVAEFKEGSYIKIDITGPLNDGYVQVEDITENENSVSASFVTMEGHVEKGRISFQIATDSDGNLTFSINSKSEVDQGAAKQIEGYSRSQQMKSWQEVLTNFVNTTGGEEKSREQNVTNP